MAFRKSARSPSLPSVSTHFLCLLRISSSFMQSPKVYQRRDDTGGDHGSHGTPPVTAGQPQKRIRREISSYEVQGVRTATPLLAAHFHFTIKEVAKIRSGSCLTQVGANVSVKLCQFCRIRLFFLNLVINHSVF